MPNRNGRPGRDVTERAERRAGSEVASLESRALELFDRCADMAPRARAQRLESLRRSDPELHARVARLLAADAQANGLPESPQKILSHCAPQESAGAGADRRIGSRLGVWRIDGVIGAGGMGRVYLASRADGQYAQTVALKCIQADAATPVLAEVLRNERDMLAMLEHPNIATLLDGGVDADGGPWFAMQRVQGEAIDQWCDRRRLDLRARVALFIRLCEGLRYAHGKGALHGDLKPSNVLVDDSGRPILLDFGLSSLAARSHGGVRQVAMTPGYTAPEVASQGNSVASDIHALGVMLRALLCGVGPAPGDTFAASTPLPLPSEEARRGLDEAARLRGCRDRGALAKALAGDLDAIVSACVAPDPADRPASIAHLQDDLRAWLAYRPVSLRRARAGYRLRLFLRRNRVATAVAILVLAGVAAGVGSSLYLHDQASDHAQAAQAMRRLFENSFDALTTGGLGQSSLMSAPMLRDAEASLRGGEAGGGLDARTASLMLLVLARSYTTLGDYRHAMDLLEEAQARSVGRDDQEASIQAAMAHLFNIQSRYALAAAAAKAGRERLGAVPRAERESAGLALEVELARAQWGMARIEQGQATLQQALVRAEKMASRDPRPLAALLIQQGQWSSMFSRKELAVVAFERAIELTRERAPLIADEATVELVPTLKQLSRHERAVELASALLDRRRRLLGEDHPETGKAWQLLGYAHFWQGDTVTALEFVQRGEAILAKALGDTHPETVRTSMVKGIIYSQIGRSDEAEAIARRGLALLESVYGPAHQETMKAVGHLAAVLATRASARTDARNAWQEVVDLFARRVEIGLRQGLPVLSERMVLIKAKLRLGQADQAVQDDMEEIVAALREEYGATSDAVYNAITTLGEVYIARGEKARARHLMESSLREIAAAPDTMISQSVRLNNHEKLGELALAEGRRDQARSHWQQALEISRRIEPGSPSLRKIEERLAALGQAPARLPGSAESAAGPVRE